MQVTVGIPTKNRYDTLILTLQAVAFQAYQGGIHVIMIDDSDNPVDLRTLQPYQCIFELFNQRKITFELEYGTRRGQHISHQRIQDKAETDWIWRVDDDEIPEANVLDTLIARATNRGYSGFDGGVGAVGGLVLPPNPAPVPDGAANLIKDVNLPNVQWFRHPPTDYPIEVEHLHSTFLYRRGVAQYDPFLSPAAHREETLFTYEILRKGFRLLVHTGAVTWHFRNATGGIRSHQNAQFWENDEKRFQERLEAWGACGERTKYLVLDAGRGDHVIVKSLLPRIKEKYPKLIVATCFRDIFNGEVEQISIAEARNRLGDLGRFNVYRWCQEHAWRGELAGAYEAMLEL